jgi:hypothetical protein
VEAAVIAANKERPAVATTQDEAVQGKAGVEKKFRRVLTEACRAAETGDQFVTPVILPDLAGEVDYWVSRGGDVAIVDRFRSGVGI